MPAVLCVARQQMVGEQEDQQASVSIPAGCSPSQEFLHKSGGFLQTPIKLYLTAFLPFFPHYPFCKLLIQDLKKNKAKLYGIHVTG